MSMEWINDPIMTEEDIEKEFEYDLYILDEFESMNNDVRYKRDLCKEENVMEIEIDRLRNKILIEDILDYLPSKILIYGNVYQPTLKYKGPLCWIHLDNRIGDTIGEDNELIGENGENDELLHPEVPFKFHKDDTAYLLKEILNLLIDTNAVEVTENLRLEGNHKIFKNLDYIMQL